MWERQQLMFTPKKYQFKHKKLKNPKNKNSFIDVPWGSSQMIKVVLVMLISGILLSEKHPTRYQLGLW